MIRAIVSAALLWAVSMSVYALEFEGTLSNSNPTQDGRLNRNGVSSSCGASKTFPGVLEAGTDFEYASHEFTNSTSDSVCVTVTFDSSDKTNANIFVAAYSGSFDPADLSVNYHADGGQSTGIPAAAVAYSFDVAPSQTIVLIAMDVSGSSESLSIPYNITVDGLADDVLVPVPSMSEWGMLLMVLTLLLTAGIYYRRQSQQ